MATLISSDNNSNALNEAVARLKLGQPVAIPTETVYGLAGIASNGQAVAKIFQIKGRPSFNPLICHVDGLVMASKYAHLCQISEGLAKHFWPGPLTLVLREKSGTNIHDLVTADLGTIGIRCPEGLARQIISAVGEPLAAPSANKSGKLSPTNAGHVLDDFKDQDLLVIDNGPSKVGLESTIISVIDGHLTLLRPGSVTIEQIETVCGLKVKTAGNSTGILAPGMMKSHYAPRSKVLLNRTECEPNSAWLGFGNQPFPDNAVRALNLSPDSNLAVAAANLYAYLKQLDGDDIASICVAPIPMEELGIAINDRLTRAAAPRN